MNLTALWSKVTRFCSFGRRISRKAKQRICGRCAQPIKRNHKWTAQLWNDRRPRHWNCEQPTIAKLRVQQVLDLNSERKEVAEKLPELAGAAQEAASDDWPHPFND